LKQLAGAVIGLAGGLGVNELSEGFGFEAVAVAAGVGSVLSTTIWLRQRPTAPIVLDLPCRGAPFRAENGVRPPVDVVLTWSIEAVP